MAVWASRSFPCVELLYTDASMLLSGGNDLDSVARHGIKSAKKKEVTSLLPPHNSGIHSPPKEWLMIERKKERRSKLKKRKESL